MRISWVTLTLTQPTTELKEAGKPIIAALHVKRTAKGFEVVNIASVYGRSKSQIQAAINGDVLYWHKTKGSHLVNAFGLQLPSVMRSDVSLSRANIKTNSDLAQYQGEYKFSRQDKKTEAASFESTAKQYGGREAYEQAKADGATELDYRQWVQVRTPEFKQWFGDWEAVQHKNRLLNMEAVAIPEDVEVIKGTIAAAKTKVKALYKKLLPVRTLDGRLVTFAMTGFKETSQHAADRRVLEALPYMDKLLSEAHLLWYEPAKGKPNVKFLRHYGVKVRFASGEAFTRIVVREDVDGNLYYDNDATSIELLIKEKALDGSRQPYREPNAGEDAEGLVKNRLANWWLSVNPDDVSKVTDPNTGEPLVVYHGTASDFGVFDGSLSGSKSKTGAPDNSFFFTDNSEVAESYTVEYDGDLSRQYFAGGNLMPVFLNISKPLKANAKGESWRDIEYKGVFYDTNELADKSLGGKTDGVIVKKVNDRGRGRVSAKSSTVFIAHNPNQIKSATGNTGAFDAGNDDIRFSRSPAADAAYERRIDDLFAGGKANLDGVHVLDRSDVLDMLGHGDVPIRLDEAKVLLNQINHPEMTAEQWEKIPEWLDNPAVVLQSRTVDGRLVFVPEETIGKAPVFVVVEPAGKGKALSVHVLVNAYAKNSNLMQAVRGMAKDIEQGNIVYIDKEKARKLLELSGLQLPRGSSLNASRKKILTEKNLQGYRKNNSVDNVVRFSRQAKSGDGQETHLTPTEKRWFNEQGELMAGVWAYQQLGNLVKPVLAKIQSRRLG